MRISIARVCCFYIRYIWITFLLQWNTIIIQYFVYSVDIPRIKCIKLIFKQVFNVIFLHSTVLLFAFNECFFSLPSIAVKKFGCTFCCVILFQKKKFSLSLKCSLVCFQLELFYMFFLLFIEFHLFTEIWIHWFSIMDI